VLLVGIAETGRSIAATVAAAAIVARTSRRVTLRFGLASDGIEAMMPVGAQLHFVYDKTMLADDPIDGAISDVAACIAEPARTRMLYCLLDGRARTSTELAIVGGVSPSTASVHLSRLKSANLVKLFVQGKHRYYSLGNRSVARALEGLSVVAGCSVGQFVPNTPKGLRAARTCYDHVAGTVGVLLYDRFRTLEWLTVSKSVRDACEVTVAGVKGFTRLGIDIEAAHLLRRRFAYSCLDWSERQPHVAGALGAAILRLSLRRGWLTQETDSRALILTHSGRQAFADHLGLEL
jgi:DNA-binding transcriptional ArsR family regulator